MSNFNFKCALSFFIFMVSSHVFCDHLSKDDQYTKLIKQELKKVKYAKEEEDKRLHGIQTQERFVALVLYYTKDLSVEQFAENNVRLHFTHPEEEFEYRKDVIKGFDHFNELIHLSENQSTAFFDDLQYAFLLFQEKGCLTLRLVVELFYATFNRHSKSKK